MSGDEHEHNRKGSGKDLEKAKERREVIPSFLKKIVSLILFCFMI